MSVITHDTVIAENDIEGQRYPRIGYRNLFREGTVTASDETTAGPKENAYDGFTYDFWQTSSGGDHDLEVEGVNSGDVVSATQNTLKISATASAVRNAYKGMKVRITAGPAAGEEKNILSYNAVTKTLSTDDWSEVDFNPSFYVPLNDLGNGEVDLTPVIGTGSATFTRATDATTVDENGLIVTVSAGTPRSYYDPTTLEYRGYLAEGARTNLCLWSQDLANAAWGKTRTTITDNATVSPDGALNADAVIESADNNNHSVFSSAVALSNATVYTFSFWAKAAGRNWVAVQGNNAGFLGLVSYDLQNGVLGTVAANTTATITAYPNGWYRCTFTKTTTSAASTSFVVYPASANNTISYQGDGTSGIYIWGAQLEAGTFPSSYIPTTASAVTRNADVLTYPFSGNADATVGAAYAELAYFGDSPATAQRAAVAFGIVSSGPLYVTNTGVNTSIIIFDGSGAFAQKTGLTSMATASRKRGSTWGAAGMSATGDGATVATGVFDGDLGSAAIGVGCSTSGGSQWFGTLKNVRIWTRQFSSAQLQEITLNGPYDIIPTSASDYEIIGSADYAAIAAHNLAGATITPQYSSDGSSWTNLAEAFEAQDNRPIVWEFDETFSKYFRFLIEDAPEAISLGVAHIGKKLSMPRGLRVGWKPPSLNDEVEFTNTMSEGGQILGRNIIRKGTSAEISSDPTSWTFSKDDWLDFIAVANQYAVFFWWSYNERGEIVYGGMTDKEATYTTTKLLNVNFKMSGINT